MIEIYFDGTYIDNDNYIDITNDFKQFENEFMIGTTVANSMKLQVPVSCFEGIPEIVNIKLDGVDYAYFIVDKYSYKDNNILELELTDKMVMFNFEYDCSSLVPCTLKTILEDICDKANVDLGTLSFTNDDMVIDYYNSTITAREYLSYIAELNGGYARIGKDGKLYLKTYDDTNYTIDTDECEDFKIGEHHTIQRVVFDNGLLKYESSSDEELETLYLNENNVYITSQEIFDSISEKLIGFDFYSFSTGNSPILSDVMAGDIITFIQNENEYKTIAQYSINYNGQWLGGYELDINSKKQQETKQQGVQKQIKQLNVRLDRDENELTITAEKVQTNEEDISELKLSDEAIEMLVSNVKEDMEENYVTVKDVEQIIIDSNDGMTNTLKHAGGTNLIRNSALLFEEDDGYEYWEGRLKKGSADEIGVISETGTVILLQNDISSQQINVTPGEYTISFKYKRLINTSDFQFKINDELQEIEESEGEFIKTISSDNTNISLFFKSTLDDGFAIYDLMMNKGNVNFPYNQHQNETTTDTVRIGKGISVESDVTDTITKIDSDGFRVVSKNNTDEVLLRATDTGTYTNTFECVNSAIITGLYIQEVNGQTWITGII